MKSQARFLQREFGNMVKGIVDEPTLHVLGRDPRYWTIPKIIAVLRRSHPACCLCQMLKAALLPSSGEWTEGYSRHATTPFINSRNRFSISRISAAITSGGRGGL